MIKMKHLLTAAGVLLATTQAAQAETVKVVMIEGLTGFFAAPGQSAEREFKYAIDRFINSKGDTKVDFSAIDSKGSPKETLIQLKNAIGTGAQVIVQGNSSAVANALSDAINKHNKRNPDQRVIYLDTAANDPALTNEKCNFWHFRFDGHADMKMNAISDVLAERLEVKKVYLIGQDYSFGKSVAAAAVHYLKKKRPDIEIVGNELHPIGKVKDFTPYVTKIKTSGAQAVITGNWGNDMVNLAKASNAIGLKADFYTYFAAGTGISAAIGHAGKDRIFNVADGRINPPMTPAWDGYLADFKAKYPNNDLLYPRIPSIVRMLDKALKKAGSADAVALATAFEGMELTTLAGDKVTMRAEDHQLLMPLQLAVHTNEGIKWDFDKSGFGTFVRNSIPADKVALPTTCKMERPSH